MYRLKITRRTIAKIVLDNNKKIENPGICYYYIAVIIHNLIFSHHYCGNYFLNKMSCVVQNVLLASYIGQLVISKFLLF